MKLGLQKVNVAGKKQTVLYDGVSKQHYLVSSIENFFTDETYIFECDSKGEISNYSEVWGIRPAQHWTVIEKLMSREITYLDFYDVD
ncbi:MAG: hypothetical protein EOM23_06340 [Candidatus Moranbacteria bacterium]|nr:hypothetical protein [Candidatus Moranbacteria bacterium]